MGKDSTSRRPFFLALVLAFLAIPSSAQEQISLDRCDVLPIISIRINGKSMRFLLDTGATTILNLNSFAGGRTTDIKISSWAGTAATSAREVTLSEMVIGNHRLRQIRLPAVDLSPIGKACGGQIDGLLGVDLLEKTGAKIDFQRRQAQFKPASPGNDEPLRSHNAAMLRCVQAFNLARTDELRECFDPEIVLYTPWGECKGRDQVIEYFTRRFFALEPRPKIEFKLHEIRALGDAIWQSYDYRIEGPGIRIVGRGMMLSRENAGQWQLLNMHNSMVN
jgi:hypothetical protein